MKISLNSRNDEANKKGTTLQFKEKVEQSFKAKKSSEKAREQKKKADYQRKYKRSDASPVATEVNSTPATKG